MSVNKNYKHHVIFINVKHFNKSLLEEYHDLEKRSDLMWGHEVGQIPEH
jgi:hypothetical protein